MDSIIKQVNQYTAYQLSAWAGQKLSGLADRGIKSQELDETDPDYKDFCRFSGFTPIGENDEIGKWVWFFSELLDSVSIRQRDGTYLTFTVESALAYHWMQMLKKKGTPSFDQAECDRLREEYQSRWAFIRSVEHDANFPDGSWDELRTICKDRRAIIDQWRDGDYKQEALATLDLAIANC